MGTTQRDAALQLGLNGDERLARAELRRQVGRLERELGGLVGAGFPHTKVDTAVPALSRQPRALGLGELEALRDSLVERVGAARRQLRERGELEARNRALLERMLASPAEYKWVRISREDVGATGCGHWHSLPRFGLLGMLTGWWRVRISSGCPLAGRLEAVDREDQGEGGPARSSRGAAAGTLGIFPAR